MKELNLGDLLFDMSTNCVAMEVTRPKLTHGRIGVLETNAETERWVPYEEIRAQINVGKLEVRRQGQPLLPLYIDRNDPVTCKHKVNRKSVPGAVEDNYLSSLERATRIVRRLNEFCKKYKISPNAAYVEVRREFEKEFPNCPFPCLKTVYRLLERDRRHEPLVKPNDLKGNRSERYSGALVEFICQMAETYFLQDGSRWSMHALTDACQRLAREKGLLPKRARLSSKFVRKVIVTRLHAMPQVARFLGKDRAAQSSVASHRIRVEGILQRVEQDAVHVPVAVMTAFGISKDVWLIHAIDCATSQVIGWRLKIGAPTETDGLLCVESSMFSKAEAYAALGISDACDVYGSPAMLVLDNGAEAKGQRFRRLAGLGVDFYYCKSRHPQKKPFVERLNLSLKQGLETLPGSTRMDGVDGSRDPVALGDKLMDLAELEYWIVRWYCDKWADTVLDRFVDEDVFEDRALGCTPRQRYQNIVERLGCPMPLPPNRRDWVRIKFNVISRKLSIKTGITYNNLIFRGDNLTRLITRFGEERVDVLYDPDDFRRVYVLDGSELVELQNQAASEFTPAYGFDEAKEHKKQARLEHTETPRSAAFSKDIYDRSMQDATSASKVARPKKAPTREQKKTVVQKTKLQQAEDRAALNPLAAPKPKETTLNGQLPMRWDDVDELSPRDRKTGALL